MHLTLENAISYLHVSVTLHVVYFVIKKANCCAEAFGGRAPPDWHGASTAACPSATSCAVTAVPGDSAALSSPETDIS